MKFSASNLNKFLFFKLPSAYFCGVRVKQIEDNKGQTIVSEGVDANYMDMLNYSVFALIKLKG